MQIDIGVLIAVIGCLVGLAGWQSSKDKRTIDDAEWKGAINAKLDIIAGITTDVEKLSQKSEKQLERLINVETSLDVLHRRFDEHLKGDCEE